MYRGHYPSSDTLDQLAQRSTLNPDQADVLTAADRQASVEQELIEQLSEHDCRAQLQRIKLKRSTTNIHAQDMQMGDGEQKEQQQQTAPADAPAVSDYSAAEPGLPAAPAAVVLSRESSSPPQLQQRSASQRKASPPGHHHQHVVDARQLDRKSTMHLQLEAILDRQIAALLDPNDQSVTRADMAGWSDDKIDQLVNMLKPQHLPELIRQSMLINELQPAKLMTWKDLTYVNQRGEPLVKNATGALASGQLIGVFSGPDGGATPLLNVLGRRAVTGQVHGELLYDGREPDESFNKTVGYVLKDDPHLATLTVYETVFFSARLRLPTSTPDSLVRFRVLMIMKLLGLSHVGNNIVGNAAVRGISGGEKRRVSFAVEMVVGHSVLLADLPTNGLDSATAFGLMRTMRFACRASTSMLCSIVQPSPELFRLFHRIVVMSKGATLYFGPPEYSEGFFASLGIVRPEAKTVPQFLEELSAAPEKFYRPQLRRAPSEAVMVQGAGGKQAEDADKLSEWEEKHVGTTHRKSRGILRPLPAVMGNAARLSCWNLVVDEYETSEFKELLEAQTVQEQQKSREEDMSLAKARAGLSSEEIVTLPATGLMRFWYRRYNSSPYQQVQQNLHRLTILFYRDKGLWRDTWIVNICMSLFLGSLFYDLSTTETDVQNRVGLLFFLCAYLGFGGLSLAPVVSFHRPTYYAQLNASYFHAFSYFFSFVFLLTPIVIVEVFLLLLPAYGLAHLTGGVFRAEFGFALVLLCVVALASRSWVLIVLSLSPNEVLANVALVMSNILFFLLAGYLLVADEIEAAYYWVHVIDYFSYAFRALAINDILPRYNDCVLNTPGCTFNTGEDALLQIYGLHSGSKKWLDFARLCGVWAAFTIAAAFAYMLLNWDVPDEPEGPNWGHGEEPEGAAAAVVSSEAEPARADAEKVPSYAAAPGGGVPSSDVEMAKTEQPDPAKAADGAAVTKSSAKSPSHAIAVPQGLNLKAAYIQWSGLCYDVVLPDGSTRRLLNNCYGYAAPGHMCALMGASGAGKSTLLDVLAGIKNQGKTQGELLINGRPRDAGFTDIVGYVEQFDSHSPASSIFEAVEFSGRLRLPSTISAEDVKAKVWNVLRLLEIDHLASAIIGAPSTGGVAPEIRKKVTIAVELIMEPSILFLDEPTTGLDSAAAYAVISTVSKLSEHVAVVCTIHQPPIEIVNFFREIILLKAGGEVVYFGPMTKLTDYFAEQGLGKVDPEKNPVDFALEQLKQANELAAAHKPSRTQDNSAVQPAAPDEQHLQDAEDEEKEQQAAKQSRAGFAASTAKSSRALTLSSTDAGRLPELFLASPYSETVKETLKRGICPPEEVKSDSAAQADLVSAQRSRAAFPTQVEQLSRRNFLNVWRNVFGLKVRFGTTLLFSFFVGTIFLRLGFSQSWGQQRLSVIFIAVANTLYGATAFMPEVYYTRTIYFREHTAGRMYSSGAYFIARYLGDAPFVIAEIFLQSVMIYFLTGLNSNDSSRNFGFFFWTLLIVRWMSIAMTHFFATVIASPGFCATLLIAYMNTMFAACGFFIPQPSIQHDWLWYYDLVPIRYALDFLVQREFVADGNEFYCSKDQLVYVDPSYNTCPGAVPDPAGSGYLLKCPIQCGDDFLVKFGVSSSTIWQVRNMAILHCWMVFFFIMAYLALRFINHIKR